MYLLLIHSDWCNSVMLIRNHIRSSMAKFNILFCWLQHMYLNTTRGTSPLFILDNDFNILYCSQRHQYLNSANKIELICGNKTPTRCNRWFLLQILLLAQHVSGTIMPIIRISRVLYKWLLPVVFGAVKMEIVIF